MKLKKETVKQIKRMKKKEIIDINAFEFQCS